LKRAVRALCGAATYTLPGEPSGENQAADAQDEGRGAVAALKSTTAARRLADRRGLSKVAVGYLSRVPKDRGRKSDLHGVFDVKERAVRPLG
jgi:hypothetical protein